MATLAFIFSTFLFILGWAAFLTMIFLILRAVAALVGKALEKKVQRREREFYDNYLESGRL